MDNIIKYNRIKDELDSRGIKQTWLAERLGKSYRTLNLYTSNDKQPSIPLLYKIAEILQVKVQDLLVEEPTQIR